MTKKRVPVGVAADYAQGLLRQFAAGNQLSDAELAVVRTVIANGNHAASTTPDATAKAKLIPPPAPLAIRYWESHGVKGWTIGWANGKGYVDGLRLSRRDLARVDDLAAQMVKLAKSAEAE
jgi:hypothetical protein